MTKDEYLAYLLEPHWREIRAVKLRASEWTCARCGYRRMPYKWGMSRRLEVHHRTYARIGAEMPEDLEVLCEDCHAIHHHKPQSHHVHGVWSVTEILAGMGL